MKTLLLDQSAWDLVVDAHGDIAVAEEPYAQAQDVASSIRTFQGEVYYDTGRGIPHFAIVLGAYPSAQVIKTAFENAALLVPGVVSAATYLRALANRQLTGQVQFTTSSGVTLVAAGPATPVLPGQLNFSDPQQSGWL